MAAPSPALSNSSSDAAPATTSTANATTATAASAPIYNLSHRTGTPPKTLRGLNKPKCRVCGNVARSRCPYESCKSCCSRNQNPCYIHVLKENATFSEKTPTSTPLFDQKLTKSTDSSPSGTRTSSLRQLSSIFSQFRNVQIPLHSKKPLTRKDAAAINEWRFTKLKEYHDRNIEVENDAFDRYIQNCGLLEEVFSMNSILEEGPSKNEPSMCNDDPSSNEYTNEGLKFKFRLNPVRSDNLRKRVRQIVDQGLKKLKKIESHNISNEDTSQTDINKGLKTEKSLQAERSLALSDLIEKLNKARNEEDLKSCLKVKSQLFNQHNKPDDHNAKNLLESRKELNFSFPKLVSTIQIDQETLNSIDTHFSSLEHIDEL